MSISKKLFGVLPSGENVSEYTLTNRVGASVSIIDFGGTLINIIVPDRDGKLADVNLSYNDVATYAGGQCGSMGALIGRVGNRIAGATFDLDGITYVLGKNNGENNLHGGPIGYHLCLWKATPVESASLDTLTLHLISPDGDQNFPGKLNVTVDYTWNDACELGIHYHAVTDKATLVNLTNHAYFNLDGHDAGSINDLVLQMNADLVTEVTPDLIPTGKLLPVAGLCYDFTSPTRIGNVLDKTEACAIMTSAGGVDFNYCAGHDHEQKIIAVLSSPATGRVMEVITDLPGVQCYTGQGLNYTGKNDVHYAKFAGICLETQRYPDAIHHANFPSIVLRPQEEYDTMTIYRFSVK